MRRRSPLLSPFPLWKQRHLLLIRKRNPLRISDAPNIPNNRVRLDRPEYRSTLLAHPNLFPTACHYNV